jgi:hypothetical protein
MADRSNAQAGSSSDNGSSWWYSIRKTFSSEPRTRNYDDDEEDEPLLPSRLGKRQRFRTGWEQIFAYVVILALGVVVGGFIGRRYSSRGDGKGHGPMVAPVWTLPPVCLPFEGTSKYSGLTYSQAVYLGIQHT